MSRLFKLLLFLALALILVGGLAFGALYLISGGHPVDFAQTALIKLTLQGKQDALDLPLSSDTTPVRFIVEMGDPPALIAQNLAAAGLISDASLFVDYVRAYDIDVQLGSRDLLPQKITVDQADRRHADRLQQQSNRFLDHSGLAHGRSRRRD